MSNTTLKSSRYCTFSSIQKYCINCSYTREIAYLQNHYAHPGSREKISTEDWKVILRTSTYRHIQHLHTTEPRQLQPDGSIHRDLEIKHCKSRHKKEQTKCPEDEIGQIGMTSNNKEIDLDRRLEVTMESIFQIH